VSSVVWSLIDNGKLANQIARLVAIVVKAFSLRLAGSLAWVSETLVYVPLAPGCYANRPEKP